MSPGQQGWVAAKYRGRSRNGEKGARDTMRFVLFGDSFMMLFSKETKSFVGILKGNLAWHKSPEVSKQRLSGTPSRLPREEGAPDVSTSHGFLKFAFGCGGQNRFGIPFWGR